MHNAYFPVGFTREDGDLQVLVVLSDRALAIPQTFNIIVKMYRATERWFLANDRTSSFSGEMKNFDSLLR